METVKVEELHELWLGYQVELGRAVKERADVIKGGGSEVRKAMLGERMAMYIKFLRAIKELAGNPGEWELRKEEGDGDKEG